MGGSSGIFRSNVIGLRVIQTPHAAEFRKSFRPSRFDLGESLDEVWEKFSCRPASSISLEMSCEAKKPLASKRIAWNLAFDLVFEFLNVDAAGFEP
jgi:hypothetical protein